MTGRSSFDPRQRRKDFPLTPVSGPALGLTQPPVQWVPGVLSPGLKHGRGMTLTTHPHLVPRSRMGRSYTSSPPKHLHGVCWDSFSFYKYVKCKYYTKILTKMLILRSYIRMGKQISEPNETSKIIYSLIHFNAQFSKRKHEDIQYWTVSCILQLWTTPSVLSRKSFNFRTLVCFKRD
jgi:hypothetical protein